MSLRTPSLLLAAALLPALALSAQSPAGSPAATEPAPTGERPAASPSAAPATPVAVAAAVLNEGLGPAPEEVHRATPRETVLGYLDACREGRYGVAAHYLDLDHVPAAAQQRAGQRLARRFKFVLDQKLWVDRDDVSDEPGGRTDDGLPASQEEIGSIPLGGGEQGVRVVRLRLPDGSEPWVFSPSTVRAIDALYGAYGIGWFGDNLPRWLYSVRVWEFSLWQLLGLALIVPLGYGAGRLVAPAVAAFITSTAARTRATWDDELAAVFRAPLRLSLTAAAVGVASEPLRLSLPAEGLVMIVVRTAMLVALGLFGRGAIRILAVQLEAHLARDVEDPLHRQGVATQVSVLQRIAGGAVILLVVALILAQFQVVRTVGISLLASAGIAGLTLGFAAQRSVANLFAGVQIMLSQPIRIDDVVIVEGEWGRIEEINFTHVVVKIWDLRRLVVPIAYFLEKPFQNWTRVSPELLGTIFFYTDHTVDVAGMRAELERILAATDLWDGKVQGIVVTGIKDHVVEVRALVSAADSGRLWDLRCHVREGLLRWLQAQPGWLPTFRLDARGDLSVAGEGRG
jgi:small-conductance mechanosensitive channel